MMVELSPRLTAVSATLVKVWRFGLSVSLGAALITLFVFANPQSARADIWKAGDYSFSDELGGFKILSASGTGTPSDPIILVQEIYSADPAVVVIRNHRIIDGKPKAYTHSSFLSLAMVTIIFNRSERVWGGFDLELQQIIKKPSTYGDGLSFDQTGAFRSTVESDRFFNYRQVEEPLDRIHFYDGGVSPGDQVRFNFFITDPTPVEQFFLVQEPFFLMTESPAKRPQWAIVERPD